MVWRLSRSVLAIWLLLTSYLSPLTAQTIQDNSFLIEEAYNQEAGVVQHISTFARGFGGDWDYAFTQEWPLGGIRHQLSYTIPVRHAEGNGTGLGDVALNYRYQLAGHPQGRALAAPRLSLLLPTGKDELRRGSGGVGLQVNLPVTLVMSDELVTHWNAGITATPSARNALGQKATATEFNLGASLVWLVRPSLNLLVETLWLSEATVVGAGQTLREESGLISPGVRVAFNLPGHLQVVPGLAYTFGLGPGSNEDSLFFYLSFEHPFNRQ
jgi:outer membrane putative beta-barrel porin/alpha-amylase